MKTLHLAVILLLGGLLPALALQENPKGTTLVHDVEIGKGGDRPLHAELAYPTVLPKAPMPAVIWIHGGGWSMGTHVKNPARSLVRDGYFTASIEYRLSGEATWPAALEDCRLAVRWLRANAAKYHVDPDHIGVWGASAGGHLATCLATMSDQPQYDGKGGYEGVSSQVQAVIDFSGPVDFSEGSAGIQRSIAKAPDYESPGLLGLFGGSFKDKPEVWKQASPLQFVQAGNPPFLIVQGDKDKSVPYEQSVKLVAALKKAGVPVEFITVTGGGHGLHAEPGEPPATPDSKEIHAVMVAFLDKYLKPQ